MNEQIKKFWLKAAREDSGEKWDTQEEFIERFAELIIRECAKINYREVLEHFGVEIGRAHV